METEPRFKVSFDRLVKPGIEPATPGLQGKWFIHYTTAAPKKIILSHDATALIDIQHYPLPCHKMQEYCTVTLITKL